MPRALLCGRDNLTKKEGIHILWRAYVQFTILFVDEQKLAAAELELADIFVVADAVTTPYQAVVQAGVEKDDLTIVFGIGGVGGYAVQVARAFGATVIAIDVDQTKLDKMASMAPV